MDDFFLFENTPWKVYQSHRREGKMMDTTPQMATTPLNATEGYNSTPPPHDTRLTTPTPRHTRIPN
jgi:hypothetical protein